MAATMHNFANAAELARNLADKVAASLSTAIAKKGTADIAVSGGSTPKAFFQELSTRDLDWTKVTITLVDERFVPADNPRSNHLLVISNLLQNKAKAAKFQPLYQPAATVEEAAKLSTAATASACICRRTCRARAGPTCSPYGCAATAADQTSASAWSSTLLKLSTINR